MIKVTFLDTYHINPTIKRLSHSGYNIISNLFIILPLNIRFNIINRTILYKLLYKIIECPEILERLNFRTN